MQSLTINTSTNKYHVFIGTKLRFKLSDLLDKQYKRVMIITDSNVANLYLNDVINVWPKGTQVTHAIVPSGESSKSQQQYFDLLTKGLEAGLDRNSLIVALGGGMVGDLAGFVAATYMRGIDYVQVPTTILAHDSSVGGKVAINHPMGKNLIGSFYPPQAVIYDVDTLHSLPEKEIRSGYAEVIKHGLISDEEFFHQVIETTMVDDITNETLTNHLIKGIKVKATIVENDEKESNIRKYLNYGHTLAHALEAEMGYGQLTHGEAVAIGMLFATRVSSILYKVELPYDLLFSWLKKNNYPLNIPQLNIKSLISLMKKDKKSVDSNVQMVLLKSIGQPTVEPITEEQLELELTKFFRELAISD